MMLSEAGIALLAYENLWLKVVVEAVVVVFEEIWFLYKGTEIWDFSNKIDSFGYSTLAESCLFLT